MDLGLGINLQIADAGAFYGWVNTPEFVHPDQMNHLLEAEYESYGIKIDKDLGVLMLQPLPFYQDTSLSNWTTTAVIGSTPVSNAWQQGTDATTNCACLSMVNSTNGLTWNALSDDSLTENQAWYLAISRGLSSVSSTTSSNYGYDVDTYVTIGIGSSSGSAGINDTPDNGYPIKIHMPADKQVFVEYATPDGSGGWVWGGYGTNGIYGTNISKCSDLFNQSGRQLSIYCIPIPDLNCCLIDIGNGAERIVIRGKGLKPVYAGNNQITYSDVTNFSVAAGQIQVNGTNGMATVQYFPLYYSNSGLFYYKQIQLSFQYQNNAVIDLSSSVIPDGVTCNYVIGTLDDTGNLVGYELSIAGDSVISDTISSVSPFIPCVYVKFPATYDNAYVSESLVLTESDISEVYETEELVENPSQDVDGLLDMWWVKRSARFRLTNSVGQWASLPKGRHYAAQYSRGLLYGDSNGYMLPVLPEYPQNLFMTGYVGEDSDINRNDPFRTFDLALVDRAHMPLQRVQCGIQPYLDGYCYQAACRFLMEAAGITPAWLSQDPYYGWGSCSMTPNPSGCTHFKLPIGTALDPSMSIDPRTPYFNAIAKILGLVHEVFSCNPSGVFVRVPYNDYIYNQSPIRGTFFTGDSGEPDSDTFLMGMPNWSSLTVSSNTEHMRTGIEVVGLNPNTGERIVSVLQADSVMGTGWSKSNIGFRHNQVLISRMFTDADTVNTVAQSALSKALVPAINVSWPTHFLPNFWVLDNVYISEPSLDTTGLGTMFPVTVLKIDRRYINHGGTIELSGTASGRYLQNN
jgi:hypothetical protein